MTKTTTLVIALCASVMAASVALADDDTGSPSQGVTQITTTEQAAGQAMSTLVTERDTLDQLPPSLAERLDARAPFGMNPDLSRLAIGNASNSLFLVPAHEHVCAVLTAGDGAGITCARTEDLAAGIAGPATGIVNGGAIAIFGMVPDSVESITLETGQSSSQAIETVNNTYYAVVPSGTVVRSISYQGPSGEVSYPIYDPSWEGE